MVIPCIAKGFPCDRQAHHPCLSQQLVSSSSSLSMAAGRNFTRRVRFHFPISRSDTRRLHTYTGFQDRNIGRIRTHGEGRVKEKPDPGDHRNYLSTQQKHYRPCLSVCLSFQCYSPVHHLHLSLRPASWPSCAGCRHRLDF